MSTPWVKMRANLLTNPKVIRMARCLLRNPAFNRWYCGDATRDEGSDVTRDVTSDAASSLPDVSSVTTTLDRDVEIVTRVTAGTLVQVWGVTNESADSSGLVPEMELADLDMIAGVPGFAAAMEQVGWLEIGSDGDGLRFPNFAEYNKISADRGNAVGSGDKPTAKTGAQRMREYRERQRSTPQEGETRDDVTRDVTSQGSVTATRHSDTREDKKREEIQIHPPTPQGGRDRDPPGQSAKAAKAAKPKRRRSSDEEPPNFGRFWAAYPRKVGRAAAVRAFAALEPDDATLAAMQRAIEAQGLLARCQRGEERFVPHGSTWLTGRRWEDEVEPPLGDFIGSAEGRLTGGVVL